MNANQILITGGILFSAAIVFSSYLQTRKNHPKALFVLFFTEMWERFSFYGMRALLVLYLTKVLLEKDDAANYIYGAYMALVYTMPLVGGVIADRILGFRKSIYLGGILMTIGHLVLAIPQENTFYIGLGFLVCGNGFFKPNISSFLGRFYTDKEKIRDEGFSVFYMGINVGALLGGLICGYLGKEINWHYGFGAAGIFMILGLIVFAFGTRFLGEEGKTPNNPQLTGSTLKTAEYITYALSFVGVPLFIYVIKNYVIMDYVMNPLALVAVLYIVFLAFKEEKKQRQQLLAAVILIVFSVLFWGFYEQGGGSLNLFADRNVNMKVGETTLSSAMVNNAINPFYIILLSSFFGWLWIQLGKRGIEPSTPAKFAWSFIQLGIGFYAFVWGGAHAVNGIVPLFYFALGYLLLSTGELCLSPIGLSMVTKLSPLKILGLMMGIWFLASGMGQFVAGKVGALMAIPSTDGTMNLEAPARLEIYSTVFQNIAIISIICGIILFLISPILKKWMEDEAVATK